MTDSYSSSTDSAPDSVHANKELRSQLLYLVSWPDLSQTKDLAEIGNLAKICALLSRKPTVGFMVYRSVDISSADADRILLQLHAQGNIGVFQTGRPARQDVHGRDAFNTSYFVPTRINNPDEQQDSVLPEEPAPAAAPSKEGSFLKKLWKKLIS